MAYLRNDAVNRVNLHSGIQALAQGAGGVFFFVFLLRAGVPVPAVLLSMAAILAVRLSLRPLVLPLAKRFGLKPILIAGTVAMAAQYPILAEVDGIGPTLFVLVGAVAVGEVLYYLSYNAYFATIGDAEHRGHQISAREAMIAVAGIAGPFCGAWALVAAGPRWTFAAVGLVQVAAVIPLLGAPNVPVRHQAERAFRSARPAAILLACDGWFDAAFFFIWQMALFTSLGESIPAYGGAMAFAGLVGAAFGLLLGRNIDAGHGRKAVALAFTVAAAVVLFRAASLGSPWLAVIANALGAFVMPLMLPVLGTATYNLAKASPCPFRFVLVTEGGWDVGCAAACLFAAAIINAGVPLAGGVLLALPGIGLAAFLLLRLYPRAGAPGSVQTISR